MEKWQILGGMSSVVQLYMYGVGTFCFCDTHTLRHDIICNKRNGISPTLVQPLLLMIFLNIDSLTHRVGFCLTVLPFGVMPDYKTLCHSPKVKLLGIVGAGYNRLGALPVAFTRLFQIHILSILLRHLVTMISVLYRIQFSHHTDCQAGKWYCREVILSGTDNCQSLILSTSIWEIKHNNVFLIVTSDINKNSFWGANDGGAKCRCRLKAGRR